VESEGTASAAEAITAGAHHPVARDGTTTATRPVVGSEGGAWVARYQVREAGRRRNLVIVRAAEQVEYRMEGEPVRTWHRLADGVEHRELRLQENLLVAFSPGDLRALGHAADWEQLTELVPAATRGRLHSNGSHRVAGQQAQRLVGEIDGVHLELDWLADAALPARYARKTAQGSTELILEALERVDVAAAFTATMDLRAVDYSDLGDMEHDPFARQRIRQGF
jgi:hypothetical protein